MGDKGVCTPVLLNTLKALIFTATIPIDKKEYANKKVALTGSGIIKCFSTSPGSTNQQSVQP